MSKKRYSNNKQLLTLEHSCQTYGKIKENNGSHFTVLCLSDNIERIGRLTKKARRGYKIKKEDIVLIEVWDFETDRRHCDILGLAVVPNDVKERFDKYENKHTGSVYISFTDQSNIFDDITKQPSPAEVGLDEDFFQKI